MADLPQPTPSTLATWRATAKTGSAPAAFNLGLYYDNRFDVSRDFDDLALAESWYVKAADSGDADAAYNLSRLLIADETRSEDQRIQDSQRWLRQAAAAGHVSAAYNLGRSLTVIGLHDDARPWLEYAAKREHAKAAYHLGVMLISDEPDTAETWLRQSAASGHLDAAFMLSTLLDLMSRPEEADRWLRKAAAGGHVAAALKLEHPQ